MILISNYATALSYNDTGAVNFCQDFNLKQTKLSKNPGKNIISQIIYKAVVYIKSNQIHSPHIYSFFNRKNAKKNSKIRKIYN